MFPKIIANVAACAFSALTVAACTPTPKQVVEDCTSQFVTRRHADPAAANRACSCLVERLPRDKVAEGQGTLLMFGDKGKPDGHDKTYMNDLAWWLSHKDAIQTIRDCHFLGCAGRGSIDEGCESEAGADADHRHDYAAAIRWFSQDIAAYPDGASTAIYRRGAAYLKAGLYKEAIPDLEKSAQNGVGGDAYRYLALAYHRIGRERDALVAANTSIAGSPEDVLSYRYRAEIYESLGRRKEAIADYRKIVEINRGDENRDIAREALIRLGEK